MTTGVLEVGQVIAPARFAGSTSPSETGQVIRSVITSMLTHGGMGDNDSEPQEVLAALQQHHSPDQIQQVLQLPLMAVATELTIADFFGIAQATRDFYAAKREQEAEARRKQYDR
jgi:hypothetical protein